MDGQKSELQRLSRAAQDDAVAHAALLTARLRSGELEQHRLEAAAIMGSVGACLAIGGRIMPVADVDGRVRACACNVLGPADLAERKAALEEEKRPVVHGLDCPTRYINAPDAKPNDLRYRGHSALSSSRGLVELCEWSSRIVRQFPLVERKVIASRIAAAVCGRVLGEWVKLYDGTTDGRYVLVDGRHELRFALREAVVAVAALESWCVGPRPREHRPWDVSLRPRPGLHDGLVLARGHAPGLGVAVPRGRSAREGPWVRERARDAPCPSRPGPRGGLPVGARRRGPARRAA